MLSDQSLLHLFPMNVLIGSVKYLIKLQQSELLILHLTMSSSDEIQRFLQSGKTSENSQKNIILLSRILLNCLETKVIIAENLRFTECLESNMATKTLFHN